KLLYGKDAFDGLRIMDHVAGGRLAALDTEIEQRLAKRSQAEEVIARSKAQRAERAAAFEASKARAAAGEGGGGGAAVATPVRSDVATDVAVPEAPFWGSRVIEKLDLDEI